jgi:glycosyltransferase involved in cell wall biosynthesis
VKILHVIGTYKPAYVYGGPIFSVSLLCENLAKAGHEVRMLTTTANGKFELEVPTGKIQRVDGVEVIYFKRWTGDHSHFSPGLFWQIWKDCKRYDAVHIHAWWNLPAIVSALICWLRGVKPVLSPRGMLSDFTFGKNHSSVKGIFHRTVGKFLLRKTKLHLTAEAEQQECRDIGAESFVLPNFIQTADDFNNPDRKDSTPGTGTFTLLFLSRIHEKKNLEGLLDALRKVSFEVKLQVAGNGEASYLEHLQDLAAANGIANRVQWLGELYDEDKFRCYAAADLFVLPSFNENFANVVIEALSAGTPVLVSEAVGLAEYVQEQDLGWTCGTGSDEIAAALEKALKAAAKREKIRRKAPAVIERDFSPKSLTQKYLKEYRRLLPNVSSKTAKPQSGIAS